MNELDYYNSSHGLVNHVDILGSLSGGNVVIAFTLSIRGLSPQIFLLHRSILLPSECLSQ
jgi:hypothetical protein